MPINLSGARRRALLLPFLLLLPFADASAQRFDRARAARMLREPNVPAQFLVKFYDPEFAPDPDALAAYAPGGIRNLYAIGNSGIHLLQTTRGGADVLAELSQHPAVESIEPDYTLSIDRTSNDPLSGQIWALGNAPAGIGAPLAWNVTTGTRSITVGVIDTGTDLTHPDLVANLWSAPRPFSFLRNGSLVTCPAGSRGYDFVNSDCVPNDDNGHGSHVAGTIGATGDNGVGAVGVNWQTTILSLKFLGANGSGSASDAIAAMDLALELRKQFPVEANLRILNNSWGGGPYSEALNAAIVRAQQANVLLVFAAGNEGRNNDSGSALASYVLGNNNIIAVAASDSNDNLAAFSNRGGTTVHLAAPGVGIVSTSKNGQYANYSGTSMAAPHVSGAAALVLAACPLTLAQLRDSLLTNVDARIGLVSQVSTGGRLNVDRAIQQCATPSVRFDSGAATQRVRAGAATTFSLTLRKYGNVTARPTVAVTGAPAGVTVVQPASWSFDAAQTLTVNASATARPGTYTLTATLMAGTATATTPLTLIVEGPAGFSLAELPAPVRGLRGSVSQVTVRIARDAGFTAPVTVRLSNLPADVTAPAATISAGTATSVDIPLTVPVASAAGTYILSVVATSTAPALSNTTTLRLEVAATPPSLAMGAATSIYLQRSRSVSIPITITRTATSAQPVVVNLTGLPAGVTARPLTIPATGTTGTLVLTASSNPATTSGMSVRFEAPTGTPALTAVVNAILRVQ